MKIKITELQRELETEPTDLVMITDPETGISTAIEVRYLSNNFAVPSVAPAAGVFIYTHIITAIIDNVSYDIPCSLTP